MIEEWKNEPEFENWEHHGVQCAIVRHPSMLHLCGYVGVTKNHPWYEADYDDCKDTEDEFVEVHGGLTFSAWGSHEHHKPTHNEHGEKLWWVGFDCAHSGDLVPASYQLGINFLDEMYRNIEYVRRETNRLARIAKEVGEE